MHPDAPKATPVTEAELAKLDELIAATLNPRDVAKLMPDEGGYYWSKEGNALNHYANPWFLHRMACTIRGIMSERGFTAQFPDASDHGRD